MEELGRVLATAAPTLLGVVAGAGLTYWFGALNRRHQEAREDATRWYERRAQAYAEFYSAIHEAWVLTLRDERPNQSEREQLSRALVSGLDAIRLVGSPEAQDISLDVFTEVVEQVMKGNDGNAKGSTAHLEKLAAVARRDLGHPATQSSN